MNSRACPEPGSYTPSREPAVETARRSRDLSGAHRLHGATADNEQSMGAGGQEGAIVRHRVRAAAGASRFFSMT